jgi:excinuclease ABC subunit C
MAAHKSRTARHQNFAHTSFILPRPSPGVSPISAFYNPPVAAPFHFDHHLDFSPENSDTLLRQVPAAPGVFSLCGEDPTAAPYLTRTADLRRRLRRILAPPDALNPDGTPILSKRLNLRDKVRFIAYTRTGSDFESTLVLYNASRAAFGPEEARRRLRLYPPFFLRVTMQHPHPRVYSTNRLSKKSLAESFGPFPSRAAADRYCDAVLDLFLLRRCHEDLHPYPDHPGCIYGDIHKCLQPCKEGNPQACTPAQYAAEAGRVFAFFRTRGQSLLDEVAAQREAASSDLDFELAAALHKHWEKVRSATLLAGELIRPVPELRAIILQPAAPLPGQTHTDEAAVFLLEHGRLLGPGRLSTLGVRAVREQTAVGSSLFAQPLMLAPIPLEETPIITQTPETRAQDVLQSLSQAAPTALDINQLCDALSLFRRWYYRPDKQRSGEVFLPNAVMSPGDPALSPGDKDNTWPIRRILNGAARVVLGPPTTAPTVDREAAPAAAKALKTKVIHPGREGIEREVPILPKRPRTRKAATPNTITE